MIADDGRPVELKRSVARKIAEIRPGEAGDRLTVPHRAVLSAAPCDAEIEVPAAHGIRPGKEEDKLVRAVRLDDEVGCVIGQNEVDGIVEDLFPAVEVERGKRLVGILVPALEADGVFHRLHARRDAEGVAAADSGDGVRRLDAVLVRLHDAARHGEGLLNVAALVEIVGIIGDTVCNGWFYGAFRLTGGEGLGFGFIPIDIAAVGEVVRAVARAARARTHPEKVCNDELRRVGIACGAVRIRFRHLKSDVLPEFGGALHVNDCGHGVDFAVVVKGDAHRARAALALLQPLLVVVLPIVRVAEGERIDAVHRKRGVKAGDARREAPLAHGGIAGERDAAEEHRHDEQQRDIAEQPPLPADPAVPRAFSFHLSPFASVSQKR